MRENCTDVFYRVKIEGSMEMPAHDNDRHLRLVALETLIRAVTVFARVDVSQLEVELEVNEIKVATALDGFRRDEVF